MTDSSRLKQLKQLRQSKKMTQEKLAQRAGISVSCLSGIEQTGRANLDTLTKIAGALDMRVSALLAYVEL